MEKLYGKEKGDLLAGEKFKDMNNGIRIMRSALRRILHLNQR